jgi:hypothetical protein
MDENAPKPAVDERLAANTRDNPFEPTGEAQKETPKDERQPEEAEASNEREPDPNKGEKDTEEQQEEVVGEQSEDISNDEFTIVEGSTDDEQGGGDSDEPELVITAGEGGSFADTGEGEPPEDDSEGSIEFTLGSEPREFGSSTGPDSRTVEAGTGDGGTSEGDATSPEDDTEAEGEGETEEAEPEFTITAGNDQNDGTISAAESSSGGDVVFTIGADNDRNEGTISAGPGAPTTPDDFTITAGNDDGELTIRENDRGSINFDDGSAGGDAVIEGDDSDDASEESEPVEAPEGGPGGGSDDNNIDLDDSGSVPEDDPAGEPAPVDDPGDLSVSGHPGDYDVAPIDFSIEDELPKKPEEIEERERPTSGIEDDIEDDGKLAAFAGPTAREPDAFDRGDFLGGVRDDDDDERSKHDEDDEDDDFDDIF